MSRRHSADTAHVVPLLESYHAGTLAPEAAAEVRQHLSACAICHGASDEIALYQIIRAAPAPRVGPELRQRVYSRIVAASAQESVPAARASSPLRQRKRQADITSLEHPHSPHPRGGWLSGVTAVAMVVLLVSVFWALPALGGRNQHLGQPGSVVNDSACSSEATSAKIPTNALISDMALTSPTSGWAVGGIMNDKLFATQGLIMRFSQCHWAPISLDLPNIGLGALVMDSASDGWAIGNHTDRIAPALLHYSDGTWKLMPLPDDPLIQQSYFDTLRMRAPGDGWITAFTRKTPQGQMSPMLLLHLSGESLTKVASPVAYPYDMVVVGPNDLWVVGQVASATSSDQPDTYRFAHYHEGQWSVMNQPAGAELMTLHAASPTDIWANGYIPNLKSPAASVPVVAHYDGATWQVAPQSVPAKNLAASVIPLGNGVGWAYRLSQPAPSATGPTSTVISAVWSETGGQWQALPWPYKDIDAVRAWASISDHEFWAIGSYRVTFSVPNGSGGSSGGGYDKSVLLHYANGVWTRYG